MIAVYRTGMLFVMLILAQAQPAPAAAPQTREAPCRLMGPKGKLIDVDPAICQQSTWDNVALPQPAGGLSTTMALDIDEAGRVTACRIVVASGAPSLDAKACEVAVDRARYQPATDADGRAIRATKQLKVTWSLPK